VVTPPKTQAGRGVSSSRLLPFQPHGSRQIAEHSTDSHRNVSVGLNVGASVGSTVGGDAVGATVGGAAQVCRPEMNAPAGFAAVAVEPCWHCPVVGSQVKAWQLGLRWHRAWHAAAVQVLPISNPVVIAADSYIQLPPTRAAAGQLAVSLICPALLFWTELTFRRTWTV